jgi:hypothetical protein
MRCENILFFVKNLQSGKIPIICNIQKFTKKQLCHLWTELNYNFADRCKMKRGKSLKPIHDAMRKWGEKFQEKQKSK